MKESEALARKIHERYCEHAYGADCEAPVKVLASALDEARLAAIQEMREWATMEDLHVKGATIYIAQSHLLTKLAEMERG